MLMRDPAWLEARPMIRARTPERHLRRAVPRPCAPSTGSASRSAKGGAFGLVGESGSGKSTVLRAIAGLITDWSGQDPARRPAARPASQPGAERRKLQMVFQDPYGSLHPRHTIDRILSEPCRIHGLDRVGEPGRATP